MFRRVASGDRAAEEHGACMSEDEFLATRAAEELAAAVRTSDQRVRKRHLELADAYSFRLREWKSADRRADVRLAHQAVCADLLAVTE